MGIFTTDPQIAQQLSTKGVCWRSVGGLWQKDLHGFPTCVIICMVKSHIKQIETDLKQTFTQTFKQTPLLCAISGARGGILLFPR